MFPSLPLMQFVVNFIAGRAGPFTCEDLFGKSNFKHLRCRSRSSNFWIYTQVDSHHFLLLLLETGFTDVKWTRKELNLKFLFFSSLREKSNENIHSIWSSPVTGEYIWLSLSHLLSEKIKFSNNSTLLPLE